MLQNNHIGEKCAYREHSYVTIIDEFQTYKNEVKDAKKVEKFYKKKKSKIFLERFEGCREGIT
jgi:hypothetical protein